VLSGYGSAAVRFRVGSTIDWRVVFSSRATLDRQRRVERAEQRTSLVAAFVTAIQSIFSALFPFNCKLCDILLLTIFRVPACQECLDSIRPIRAPRCVQCGERLLPAQLLFGDGHCQGCRDFEPQFDHAVSFGEYAGELRGLIHLLKCDKVLPAAPVLGDMLARAIKQIQGSGEDFRPLIVPVPLHAGKRGERGFHQAALIVRAAVKCLPQPMEVASGLLQRGRPTRWQVGLSSEERIANIRGGFRVTDPQRVKGVTVIVFDDVLTTGKTGSECARVLKKAGAERVWAATVAPTFKTAVLPKSVEYGEEEALEAAEVAVSV
jgi:ComF family protein